MWGIGCREWVFVGYVDHVGYVVVGVVDVCDVVCDG